MSRTKPIALHVVGGNPNRLTKEEIRAREKAEEKLRPPANRLRAPDWLQGEARLLFQRIVRDMADTELYTNVEVQPLAIYCDAVEKHRVASEEVERDGPTIAGARGGLVQHPAVLAATKYAQIIARYGAMLGLDPSSRASLAIPREEDKPKDDFAARFGS